MPKGTGRKEFLSFYLNSLGFSDEKGNKLPTMPTDDEKESLKKKFIDNIVTQLSKCYAQIEVAKKLGYITNNEADKIMESATDKNNVNIKKDRKLFFINDMDKRIKKVIGESAKVETNNIDLY
jgi:hypothetical protein